MASRMSLRARRRPPRLEPEENFEGAETPTKSSLSPGEHKEEAVSPPSTHRTFPWRTRRPGSFDSPAGGHANLASTAVVSWEGDSEDDDRGSGNGQQRRGSLTSRLSRTLSAKGNVNAAEGGGLSSTKSRSMRVFFGGRGKDVGSSNSAAQPAAAAAAVAAGASTSLAVTYNASSSALSPSPASPYLGVETKDDESPAFDPNGTANSARALGVQLRASRKREAMLSRNLEVALATIMHLQGCVAQSHLALENIIEEKLSAREVASRIMSKEGRSARAALASLDVEQVRSGGQNGEGGALGEHSSSSSSQLLLDLLGEMQKLREEAARDRRLNEDSNAFIRALRHQRAAMHATLKARRSSSYNCSRNGRRWTRGDTAAAAADDIESVVELPTPRRKSKQISLNSPSSFCSTNSSAFERGSASESGEEDGNDGARVLHHKEDTVIELELLLEQRDDELHAAKRELEGINDTLVRQTAVGDEYKAHLKISERALAKVELELEALGHAFSKLRSRHSKLKSRQSEERRALRKEMSKNAALEMLVGELRLTLHQQRQQTFDGCSDAKMGDAATVVKRHEDSNNGSSSSSSSDDSSGGSSRASARAGNNLKYQLGVAGERSENEEDSASSS